jgi:methyl-accepting chemotaxis protein
VRRFLSIGFLLQAVTGLLTAILAIIASIYALHAIDNEHRAKLTPAFINIETELYKALKGVRLEKSGLNAFILAESRIFRETSQYLERLREESKGALNSGLRKLQGLGQPGIQQLFDQITKQRNAYLPILAQAEEAAQKPRIERPADIIANLLAANGKLVDTIDAATDRLKNELDGEDQFVTGMVQVKQLAWATRTETRNDRFLITEAIAKGEPITEEEKVRFRMPAERTDVVWKLVEETIRQPHMPSELVEAVNRANQQYFTKQREMREQILERLSAGEPSPISSTDWLLLSAAGQRSIFEVGSTALKLASTHATEQYMSATREFYGAVAFLVTVVVIGIGNGLLVILRIVQPIRVMTQRMQAVAAGDLSCKIPYERRSDEIGSLADALRIFQETAIENQKLQVAKLGAEATIRAKSEFLAAMSYELRTPLNAIIGFSDILKSEMFGPLGERYREYASHASYSGQHLLKLIGDILDLAKFEDG